MKCVIKWEGSFYLPSSQRLLASLSRTYKRTDVQQSTLPATNTCITHMNHWSKKTLITEPICLLLHPSLKIPPCLIRTHPPHLRYACHWMRPKVFKLSAIGCGLLHTQMHEMDDRSCFRATQKVELHQYEFFLKYEIK